MNATEADALAKRIINCWRGGPPLREWCEVLATLNTQQADQTFVKLRDELSHAPSIHEFKTAYRALQRSHLDQSWRQTPEPNPISLDEYLRRRPEDADRFHREVDAS